jgi:hypothetical protein
MTDAKDKQSESCEGCPQNEWPDAGGGKPCKNGVRVALIAENATKNSSIMTIDVSPTSIKSFVDHVKKLQGVDKLPVQVTTDISFDPKQTYPRLIFSNPTPHDNLVIAMGHRAKASNIL